MLNASKYINRIRKAVYQPNNRVLSLSLKISKIDQSEKLDHHQLEVLNKTILDIKEFLKEHQAFLNWNDVQNIETTVKNSISSRKYPEVLNILVRNIEGFLNTSKELSQFEKKKIQNWKSIIQKFIKDLNIENQPISELRKQLSEFMLVLDNMKEAGKNVGNFFQVKEKIIKVENPINSELKVPQLQKFYNLHLLNN